MCVAKKQPRDNPYTRTLKQLIAGSAWRKLALLRGQKMRQELRAFNIDLPVFLFRDSNPPEKMKSCSVQPTTVSGLTINGTLFQPGQRLRSNPVKIRFRCVAALVRG